MQKAHPRSASKEVSRSGSTPPRHSVSSEGSSAGALQRQIGNRAVTQMLSETGSSPILLKQMLPRLGNQGAVRQLSSGGARQPVIQRKIDLSPSTISLDDRFIERVSAYNEIGDDAPLHEKINALSVAEREVFQWFTTRNSDDLEEDPEAVQMRKLMDLLHRERHTLVDQSIRNDDHEREEDLPIAGFDALDPEIKQRVRRMWKELVKNEGKIKITELQDKKGETIAHDGFSTKVLAEFSRMLESEFGRSLLTRINESDKTITIAPFKVGDGGVFAATPTSPESANLRMLNGEPEEDRKSLYKEIVLDDLNKEQRIALVNGLRRENKDQQGVALVLGSKKQYYAFGEGSDVKVTMPSDLTESSLHYENRLIDSQDHELIAPIFSTLNHELGHAAHMQEGAVTSKAKSMMELVDDRDSLGGWSNMEEYINIKGTENALRKEYGLGERKGHINMPLVLKDQLRDRIYALEDEYNDKKELKQAYRKPLTQAIEDLITFVSQNWADERKFKEAKTRVKQLPETMKLLYEEALAKQEEDERSRREPKDDEGTETGGASERADSSNQSWLQYFRQKLGL